MFPTQRAWRLIKGQTVCRHFATVALLCVALLASHGCTSDGESDGASGLDSCSGCQSVSVGDRYRSMGDGARVLPRADTPEPDEAALDFYRQIREHLRGVGGRIIEDELESGLTLQWTVDDQEHRWKQSTITAMHRARDAMFYGSVFEMSAGSTRNNWAEIVVVTGDKFDFYLLMQEEEDGPLVRRTPRQAKTLLRGDEAADTAAHSLGVAHQPLNECIADSFNADVCKFSVGVAAGPTGKALCGGIGQMAARTSCLALLLDDASLVGIADDALIPLCMAVVGITADLTCEVAIGVMTEEAGLVLCNSGLKCFARMFDSGCECKLPTSCEFCESGCGDFIGTLMCSTVNRLSGPFFRAFGGRKQHIISRICSTFGGGQGQWCRSFLEESCSNLMGNYDRGACAQACQQYCGGREPPEGCGDGTCESPPETCLNCPGDCGQCCGCVDMDGDGYGDGCGAGLDCDDTTASVHDGVAEICGNGIDEDCSGDDLLCVCGDGKCNGTENSVRCPMDCSEISYCEDRDDDDFGVGSGCYDYRDCNDEDASIHPEAEERCDGIDNNCNGHIDEGLWISCPSSSNGVANHMVCNQSGWSECLATEKSPDSCE